MKQVHKFLTYGALTALACCGCPGLLGADSSSSSATSAQSGKTLGRVERADKIIGKEIEDTSKHKLGKLDDLVVDLTSGHILYVVVDGDDGKVGVPPQILTEAHGKNITANITKDQFAKAPEFKKEVASAESINKADFVSKVYQQFGQNEWWAGNTPASQGSFNNVFRASKVSGIDVNNVNNQKIGDVKHLAVDLPAGRVVYVIVSPDASLNLGKNNLYALPPDAFTPNADHTALNSNIDKDKLAAAPHFTSDNWAQLSDLSWASQVYQYYGKQAYFSSSAPQPTGSSTGTVYPPTTSK